MQFKIDFKMFQEPTPGAISYPLEEAQSNNDCGMGEKTVTPLIIVNQW